MNDSDQIRKFSSVQNMWLKISSPKWSLACPNHNTLIKPGWPYFFRWSTQLQLPRISNCTLFCSQLPLRACHAWQKARRPLFRALWFVFVLSGSAITLYLVTRLFSQFCTNGVTIMITEERDASLTFPAITLCNLNPLGNTNMTQDHMAAYMEAIRTTRGKGHFNKGHLFDPETLFANAVTYLNNATAHQFLVACQWHVWPNGSEICQVENSQMFMYQARLGYCFTINPPVTQGFVSGFSAILYLDDSLQIKVPFYELTINPPILLGASLFVHQRKTLPNLSKGARRALNAKALWWSLPCCLWGKSVSTYYGFDSLATQCLPHGLLERIHH